MKILGDNFNFKNYVPASCKIGVHWMPWFGGKDHLDVGYKSDDPAVITRQLDQMQALGCADFVCEEYYGQMFATNKPWYQRASLHMLDQCGERGIPFCLCPSSAYMDAYGVTKTDATAVTSATIDLLNYAEATYFIQPQYLTVAGVPIVMWFGVDQFPIDWAKVKLTTNAKFLFRNASGFNPSYALGQSDGAFAWPGPWMTNDPAKNLLDPNLGPQFDFWRQGAANPTKIAIGAIYAGFNDAASSWRPKDSSGNPITRVIARRNGVTLLDSLSIVPASAQFVQVCTWNDHEEGTGIEFTLDQDYSGKLS